jgi:hypothetical protein
MKYYHLKSIVSSQKQSFHLKSASESFSQAPPKSKAYIEPTFESIDWPEKVERPAVILISAVGATGKTALARHLSRETNLPILDLAKHKPVGDNTLSGLLMQSFEIADMSRVLAGIASGSYGVIIDGIDEGRSKTAEKGFEAFLDDIAKLCKQSSHTSFLLLGRTQIVEDSWAYLADRGVPTALITISPFALADAKKYVDEFTQGLASPHAAFYTQARDTIISKLAKAFCHDSNIDGKDFLSFMGYPPVLDAIVTLLTQERNYHKLLESLAAPEGSNVEVSLLHRITTYILTREREEKVLPNIVLPLLDGAPREIAAPATAKAFSVREQSARLVAYCLKKTIPYPITGQSSIDDKYEESVAPFLEEHPFLAGTEFRNAVFEAVAVANLMTQPSAAEAELLQQYLGSHKHSYHLVYMLDAITEDHRVGAEYLSALLNAAMEFRSVHAIVELRVEGPTFDETLDHPGATVEAAVEIEIFLGPNQDSAKVFSFSTTINPTGNVPLGPKLAVAFITVPCSVTLQAPNELELASPLEVRAREIFIEATGLILRPGIHDSIQHEVVLEAHRIHSRLQTIATNSVPLTFSVSDGAGLAYPAAQYYKKCSQPPADPLMRQKYLRLRRILMEFASHSKGGLAKYRDKIEHERVLRNTVGRAVLDSLVLKNILELKGRMYHLRPDGLHEHLGVSWMDLRKGQIPDSLVAFLGDITVPTDACL